MTCRDRTIEVMKTPVAWSAGVLAARSEVRATGFEVEGRGIARWITREAAIAWAACGAFEWVALGYLAASSALIAVFAENLAHPVKLIGLQALVAAMILVLCRVEARVAERTDWGRDTFSVKFWHFWRHWYPHLFFLFCFEELGKLVHLVTPGWQDAKLIAADYWLAGVHPTVWLEQFATPARNDFMQFAYLTYFTYLLVLGGVLYYRRDWRGYWSVMTYSAVGYAIGYLIAIFFPIESLGFRWLGRGTDRCRAGPSRQRSILSSTLDACGARRFLQSMWRGRSRRCGEHGATGGGCSGQCCRW